MKYLKEMILALAAMLFGCTWAIIFAVLGVYRFLQDSYNPPSINWIHRGNSLFNAIPFGVNIAIVSFITLIVLFILESKYQKSNNK